MTDRCPDMFGHAGAAGTEVQENELVRCELCIFGGHRLVVQLFDG